YVIHIAGVAIPGYAALYSFVVNLAVSVVLSAVLNLIASDRHKDATVAADYV
ncbi:MAG: hypothetical protein JSR21_19075, partial [Proteobacteria bacterium]|nr:hypothetical protein [Pseudomonadota bacterium]